MCRPDQRVTQKKSGSRCNPGDSESGKDKGRRGSAIFMDGEAATDCALTRPCPEIAQPLE